MTFGICFQKSLGLCIFFGTLWPGVIKLPILGGIKQCKYMVVLRDFPYNSALFGLTPVGVVGFSPRIAIFAPEADRSFGR